VGKVVERLARHQGTGQAGTIGHRVRVQLIHTDVERGYIDFRCVGDSRRG